VRKLAPLFVLGAAAACAGGGGPNIDADLEKRGFEVAGCEEAGEGRFICLLESGRRVQAILYEGKVFVVKASRAEEGERLREGGGGLADESRASTSPSRSDTIFPEFPEFENVVEENDSYVVVEKIGIAAEEAERLDPRSQA
jgi:hypothetical protein